MSSQIPRPASTTTNSSTSTSSTSTTRQFSGSMDAYTLSMYEHTQRLMAAAQIPYTSPLNITSPGERGPSGTGSVVVRNGVPQLQSGSLPAFDLVDANSLALWSILVEAEAIDEATIILRSLPERFTTIICSSQYP
ncbi:hypothetical protein JMJ77_0003499 [Colletotrichum scovillei]|uniref:Uncharacterized protein n=1 Tax=Colletotrichum scovillei TaxID=1209932 RepID=A0A9P7QRS4_9PEZI|nr:hypothetical protein JMJ78_0005041 [Colletotrichum scovillei]KAG7041393.1 hypothetical protein JMJ77_0003499 [Colletotrichum scovillei]KAG7061420.1 hypothetical protein JMJ76_0000984 [Colletotrichum scovillei]